MVVSVKNIVTSATPFKIIDAIVLLMAVDMIYFVAVSRPWDIHLSYKSMNERQTVFTVFI